MIRHVVRVMACSIVSWMAATAASNAEMIHLMARKGDAQAVLGEIAKGADVDMPSTRHTTEVGVSPLFIASKFGKVDVVAALIEAGADVHRLYKDISAPYAYGTPLHVAAQNGRTEVVRVLLDAGADPNVFDHSIGTPMHFARWKGHEEVAALLEARGGEVRHVQAPIEHDLLGADLELGREIVFGCGGCHSLKAEDHDRDLRGPPLWGVVNRPVASWDGHAYSPVMQAEGGIWDYEKLSNFIAAPKRFLPGTNMWARGIDDNTRRAAAIAYLRTLADDPVPLP